MSLRTATILGCIIGCATCASAQSAGERRFALSANLGVQARSVSRTDVGNFDLNREVGVVRTSQSLGPYLVFDAGGSMRVWKRLGFGVAVARAQGRTTATIEAEVPHPFFSNSTGPRRRRGKGSDIVRLRITFTVISGCLSRQRRC